MVYRSGYQDEGVVYWPAPLSHGGMSVSYRSGAGTSSDRA
jgi:hypothetical protein